MDYLLSFTVVYAALAVRLAERDTRVLLYNQDLLGEPHPIHRLVFLLQNFDSNHLAFVLKSRNYIKFWVLFNEKAIQNFFSIKFTYIELSNMFGAKY